MSNSSVFFNLKLCEELFETTETLASESEELSFSVEVVSDYQLFTQVEHA